MKVTKITLSQAIQLIYQTKGKIFSAEFVKKDGTYRQMTCRLGVKKDLKGKGLAYDPYKYDLIGVFEMPASKYKMINLKTLESLKIKGVTYEVTKWLTNKTKSKWMN